MKEENREYSYDTLYMVSPAYELSKRDGGVRDDPACLRGHFLQ
jgi:hypothetical protein